MRMKRTIASALFAIVMVGGVLTAAAANAQTRYGGQYRNHYYRRHHRRYHHRHHYRRHNYRTYYYRNW